MDKSPDAFRTISEVADELGLPQHVLRFWETKFPQIKPMKRGGGRRYYRPDDVDLVRGIKRLLHDEGYTIKGVQKIIKDEGVRLVQGVGRPGAAMLFGSADEASTPMLPLEDADTSGALAFLPTDAGAENERPAVPEADADRLLSFEGTPKAVPTAPASPTAGPVLSDLDLAAMLAPALEEPRRRPRRKAPLFGLFGKEDAEGSDDAISSQDVARLLPAAMQSGPATAKLVGRLEAALADLEECTRILATARLTRTEAAVR